jgi:hypothetical protein
MVTDRMALLHACLPSSSTKSTSCKLRNSKPTTPPTNYKKKRSISHKANPCLLTKHTQSTHDTSHFNSDTVKQVKHINISINQI